MAVHHVHEFHKASVVVQHLCKNRALVPQDLGGYQCGFLSEHKKMQERKSQKQRQRQGHIQKHEYPQPRDDMTVKSGRMSLYLIAASAGAAVASVNS